MIPLSLIWPVDPSDIFLGDIFGRVSTMTIIAWFPGEYQTLRMNLIPWFSSLCSSFCLEQRVFMRVARQLPWCLNVNQIGWNWILPTVSSHQSLKPTTSNRQQCPLNWTKICYLHLHWLLSSQSFSRNLKHPETMSPLEKTFEWLLKLGGLTARLGSSKRAICFLNIQESREMKVKIGGIKNATEQILFHVAFTCFRWVWYSTNEAKSILR